MNRLFSLFLIISVVLLVFIYLQGKESSDYEKIADKITEKTAKKLEEKKELHLIGTGGRMMHDIQMMAMEFFFYNVVEIEAVRRLLVNAVEEYLSDINSNEKIKPYLHNYPFTAKNVQITIYFYNQDRLEVPLGKINIASAEGGNLIYYIHTFDKYLLKSIYKETYEEALQVISSEAKSAALPKLQAS